MQLTLVFQHFYFDFLFHNKAQMTPLKARKIIDSPRWPTRRRFCAFEAWGSSGLCWSSRTTASCSASETSADSWGSDPSERWDRRRHSSRAWRCRPIAAMAVASDRCHLLPMTSHQTDIPDKCCTRSRHRCALFRCTTDPSFDLSSVSVSKKCY